VRLVRLGIHAACRHQALGIMRRGPAMASSSRSPQRRSRSRTPLLRRRPANSADSSSAWTAEDRDRFSSPWSWLRSEGAPSTSRSWFLRSSCSRRTGPHLAASLVPWDTASSWRCSIRLSDSSMSCCSRLVWLTSLRAEMCRAGDRVRVHSFVTNVWPRKLRLLPLQHALDGRERLMPGG